MTLSTSNSPYNNRKWKKYRLAHLREEPLCQYCLNVGKLTPATQVDHVRTDEEYFYDTDNYLSTCARCHQLITIIQQNINFEGLDFEEAKKLKISKMRPEVNLDGFY